MTSPNLGPEGLATYLDAEGILADPLAAAGLDLRAVYRKAVGVRCLNARLARSGLLPWVAAGGEELAGVIAALALGPGDWLYPGLRDLGAAWVRGVPIAALLAQALGRAAGPRGRGGFGTAFDLEREVGPCPEALGHHLALAAGHARALGLGEPERVVVATCGEGLGSVGVFNEALAIAVQGDLPLVVVARARLWPDAVPAEAGVLGDPLAERARSLGALGLRCDGADAVAVHVAVHKAIARARAGRGPALVEVVATPLRDDSPARLDPIDRLRAHLDGLGQWTQTFHDVAEAEVTSEVDRVLGLLAAPAAGAAEAT